MKKDSVTIHHSFSDASSPETIAQNKQKAQGHKNGGRGP